MRVISTFKQHLFRWRSDGTGPLRLNQRRIFIVPSRGGLPFAAALLVMLTGAINYNLALGHALVFLLAGLAMTGMIHTFRNLHGLQISPGRCEPVFAGETALFSLLLTNERPTPRLALNLEAEPGNPVNAAVDAESGTKISIPVSAVQRGWLHLPRVRLSTRYPLGLFTAWAYLQPEMRCLVYPRPIAAPLPAPAPGVGDESGDGGTDDFAGFRDREPADSPRHIAWKASARHGGEGPLLVKQFAGGSRRELTLDWQQTDANLPAETRIGILTGWVLAAEASGCRYALRLQDQEIAAGNGEAHRQRCLQALALLPP